MSFQQWCLTFTFGRRAEIRHTPCDHWKAAIKWPRVCTVRSPCSTRGSGDKIPSKVAEFQSSLLVTSSLKDHILSQDSVYSHKTIAEQIQCKATISKLNREKSASEANNLYNYLSASLQRAVDLARGKGASTWLTVLPLFEHGFAIHKLAFHSAMALRYSRFPPKLPYRCDCGTGMTMEHALFCAKVASPHSGRTKSVTLPPLYSLKFAVLNPSCSRC